MADEPGSNAFKDDYTATLDDALKIQRRFQRILKGTNYIVGIFGSTVVSGKGHDVDVIISHAAGATKNVEWVAWQLMPCAKSLIYWERMENTDDYSDLFLNFISHDGLYVDVIIKGLT